MACAHPSTYDEQACLQIWIRCRLARAMANPERGEGVGGLTAGSVNLMEPHCIALHQSSKLSSFAAQRKDVPHSKAQNQVEIVQRLGANCTCCYDCFAEL